MPPYELSSHRIQCHRAIHIGIAACPDAGIEVWAGITGGKIEHAVRGIDRRGHPDIAATMISRGGHPALAGLGHGVEAPELLAGIGIIRCFEATQTGVTPCATDKEDA